jgi:hypothetical protein
MLTLFIYFLTSWYYSVTILTLPCVLILINSDCFRTLGCHARDFRQGSAGDEERQEAHRPLPLRLGRPGTNNPLSMTNTHTQTKNRHTHMYIHTHTHMPTFSFTHRCRTRPLMGPLPSFDACQYQLLYSRLFSLAGIVP